jgi:hypothetical protein
LALPRRLVEGREEGERERRQGRRREKSGTRARGVEEKEKIGYEKLANCFL